jgi:prepilin-type N-terminal cleavage/methylation domain-containing protein
MKIIRRQLGFTLVEMAIVLIILGFILTAFLMPLKAQRDVAFQLETQETLDNAKKALIGFAQANGRLPCPATDNGIGAENPIDGSGSCVSFSGFLPAITLGLQTTDNQGYALDAWNNRIYYAVTQSTAPVPNPITPDFTTNNVTDGMNIVGIANLSPDLRVLCGQISVPNVCNPAIPLVTNAVAVIFSTGINGALPNIEVGEDEVANKTATITFYSRSSTAEGSAVGEFDDIVTWLSPYVLYNAMIEARQIH